MRTRRVQIGAGAAAVLLSMALTACGNGDGNGDAGGGDPGNGGGALEGAQLIIGSKEFNESFILGYISALLLEDAGATTVDQTGISGTATVRAALETGEIDIYWDYTGTGWVNILGNTTEDLPEDLFGAVAEADAENGIAWLGPASFENAYRLATSAAFADEHGLATTSDAAELINANPELGSICAASEFINRDDGLPGLEQAYEMTFEPVVELDLNLIYTQVGESCEFGEVFSTDARIAANDLLVLEDDRNFFVPYQGAVTLRQETLDEFPAIADLHEPVFEVLTDDVMVQLNGRVDLDGEEPRTVAEDWLTEQGLIG